MAIQPRPPGSAGSILTMSRWSTTWLINNISANYLRKLAAKRSYPGAPRGPHDGLNEAAACIKATCPPREDTSGQVHNHPLGKALNSRLEEYIDYPGYHHDGGGRDRNRALACRGRALPATDSARYCPDPTPRA